MKLVVKIILALVMFAIGISVGLLMRPSEFKVSRSLRIDAPPAAVFAQVNNLRNWEAWSPWAALDPAMQSHYEGAQEGSGAVVRWEGNKEVGAGNMTVVESEPDKRVAINLEMKKPMEGISFVEFTFAPEEKGTLVTWTMSGHNGFAAKVMSLFVDCEKAVGDSFDKGLANMKAVAEGNTAPAR